jgi:hypothetical protein
VTPETGSLRSDLLTWLQNMGDTMQDQDGALVAAVAWAMREDPVLADLMRSQMSEGKEAVARAILEAAIERGEVAPGTEPVVLLEVIQPVVLMRLLFFNEPMDDAFFVHVVDDIALPLLRSRTT